MGTPAVADSVRITTHTDSNRGLCLFLLFAGLVASWPVWYMICTWNGHAPQVWDEWRPALWGCLIIAGGGLLLGTLSFKTVLVSTALRQVHVKDGPLRRSLVFPWEDSPLVRLQALVSERDEHLQTLWLVKLACGGHEYTIDERRGHQLASRGLAEALARAIGCPLQERGEDGVEVRFEPDDLGLSFGARALRHPSLAGGSAQQPAGSRVRRVQRPQGTSFSWGFVTPSLLFGMLGVGLAFFLVSTVPAGFHQPSYYQVARATGDYHLYLILFATIAAGVGALAGFRVRLDLEARHVRLSETLWAIPLMRRTLPCETIEEVQVAHTVRGAVVKLVGETAMIEIRAGDAGVAAWIGQEVRSHLAAMAAPRAVPPRPQT